MEDIVKTIEGWKSEEFATFVILKGTLYRFLSSHANVVMNIKPLYLGNKVYSIAISFFVPSTSKHYLINKIFKFEKEI